MLDNADVGKGLKDHMAVGLTWKVKHPEKGLALGSPKLVHASYANGWPMDFFQWGQIPRDGLKAVLDSHSAKPEESRLLLRPSSTPI